MTDLKLTEAEADALKSLLASDGWRVLLAYRDLEWSDNEVLLKIDRVIRPVVAGDELTVNESARSVLAARSAIDTLLRWPQEALSRHAKTQKPTREPTAVESFAQRMGRTFGVGQE